ncbi:hypothetical protein B0H10DRAFT_1315317 [Mycena sp. CBHHK59/15]|nr:hypothetical protein B0H10DRAFT_1315317 [Mycena sp. CBHHK59/15]
MLPALVEQHRGSRRGTRNPHMMHKRHVTAKIDAAVRDLRPLKPSSAVVLAGYNCSERMTSKLRGRIARWPPPIHRGHAVTKIGSIDYRLCTVFPS